VRHRSWRASWSAETASSRDLVERRGWTPASRKCIAMVELQTGGVLGTCDNNGSWCNVQLVVLVNALNVGDSGRALVVLV
jgi:hypothetical protein